MRRLFVILAVLFCAAAVAVPSAGAVPAPALGVTGASLTVASTGQQLYGVNANSRLLIASTTKLMTALVVFQHVKDLNTVYTAPDFVAAPADSQIGLSPGERMSVHDLMIALMLPSADDAAYDLAYNVGGGSVSRFVTWMNADAKALGLTRTEYENPIGLDSSSNYSSPYDLTRLAAYMLAHYPFFARVVALSTATLHTGNHVRVVTNTDTLLGTEPWITGVKTGHTNAAGYILVSSGTQNGLTLIASVLGTDSESARNANALALLKYGFAEFHTVTALTANVVMRRIPVKQQSVVGVVETTGGWQRVLPRSDQVRVRLQLPDQLNGPLPKGHRVGAAQVMLNGKVVATVPLVLKSAIPAVPALKQVAHFISRPTTLGVLALVLGAVVTAGAMRRRRPSAVA